MGSFGDLVYPRLIIEGGRDRRAAVEVAAYGASWRSQSSSIVAEKVLYRWYRLSTQCPRDPHISYGPHGKKVPIKWMG